MKKYPLFISVFTVLFTEHTVSGFEYFDHFKSKNRRFGRPFYVLFKVFLNLKRLQRAANLTCLTVLQ
jgi:hypothetical protein